MSDELAVSINGADKVFNQGEADEVAALSGIDLDIQPGEFVSLIGPSGCGKSTLLRLIGDLLEPTAGGIALFCRSAPHGPIGPDFWAGCVHAGRFFLGRVGGPLRRRP